MWDVFRVEAPFVESRLLPKPEYLRFGIMEKKMETTIIYWGYIGIMEKKMETTIIARCLRSGAYVPSSLRTCRLVRRTARSRLRFTLADILTEAQSPTPSSSGLNMQAPNCSKD